MSKIECGVNDCEKPALANVLPTHGETDDSAYRCRECLEYDLDRDWFSQWRGAIEEKQA